MAEMSFQTIPPGAGIFKKQAGLRMITKQDIFAIHFYEKEVFNGSFRGMRYRIAGQETEEGKVLRVTVWPGPYNHDTTPVEKKEFFDLPFSDEGLESAVERLNTIWMQQYDH